MELSLLSRGGLQPQWASTNILSLISLIYVDPRPQKWPLLLAASVQRKYETGIYPLINRNVTRISEICVEITAVVL